MTHFKAPLRHAQGLHHSDCMDAASCCGSDEAASRTHTEQHQGFGRKKNKSSHIAIVAATKALASQWICKIIARCQSSISSGTEHFGSINLHALSPDEDLTDADFDEVHVLTTEILTTEQAERFRSHTQRLFLHVQSTHQPQPLLQGRIFNWISESDLTAFLGSLISAQENGFWIAGTWASFAQTTINSGPFRVIHSHEPLLGDSLSYLLDQLGELTNSKNNCILLIVRGDENLTLGDLITAHDTVEAHFPNECEVAVTLDRTLTTGGYKLWLLLDNMSADGSTDNSRGRI